MFSSAARWFPFTGSTRSYFTGRIPGCVCFFAPGKQQTPSFPLWTYLTLWTGEQPYFLTELQKAWRPFLVYLVKEGPEQRHKWHPVFRLLSFLEHQGGSVKNNDTKWRLLQSLSQSSVKCASILHKKNTKSLCLLVPPPSSFQRALLYPTFIFHFPCITFWWTC